MGNDCLFVSDKRYMRKDKKYIKVALGTVPKAGGTYTFYRNLRAQLRCQGIDVYSVTVGTTENALVNQSFCNDGCVFIADHEAEIKKQAQAFIRWCEEIQVDIVIAINSEAIMAALPHLPERIRVVSRVASVFDSGCRNVMAGYERLAKIVITAPGQKKVLVDKYRADTGRMVLIPNGVDPKAFKGTDAGGRKAKVVEPQKPEDGDRRTTVNGGSEATCGEQSAVSGERKTVEAKLPATGGQRAEGSGTSLSTMNHHSSTSSTIQLGFLGRLEHISKGVLFIPEILKHLNVSGVEFHLTIAGTGVYERGLKRLLNRYIRNGSVEFIGELPPEETPEFLSKQDVLVFTSQSEGCPNTLIEGIMAGCVPVVWRLDGITDFIVQDSRTGYVVSLGDCQTFAEKISTLSGNRKQLESMSSAAIEDARRRFSLSVFGDAYATLFRELMSEPAPVWVPVSWESFQPKVNEAHRSNLRSGKLIVWAKKNIRRILYLLHFSHRWE